MKRTPRLDLNPSSADRWTTCTASPRFIMENWDKLPSSDTIYNQEGTTAHAVAAAELTGQKLMEATLPTPVDSDMRWHAWNYAEYVQSFRKPGSNLLVETKLPLWYMPERNMMLDAGVRNDDSLHVFDYKYGEGVVVSPVENLQTAIYAFGFGRLGEPLPTDFPVFIHIYQPRGRAAEDGASHVWETTWLAICQLMETVDKTAYYIQTVSDTPLDFAPSEKACRWCPAKGFCSARQKFLTQEIDVLAEFDEKPQHFPIPQSLSVQQISAVLTHMDQIGKWMKDVEEYATEHLRSGGKLPGWKLVTSRGGNRYWTDPKKAAALLLKDTVLRREEVIEEKVVSPGAVEKLLGKHKLSVELTALVAKTPGVPVIAPESDKRPALEDATSDFEVLPEHQQTEKPKPKP